MHSEFFVAPPLEHHDSCPIIPHKQQLGIVYVRGALQYKVSECVGDCLCVRVC